MHILGIRVTLRACQHSAIAAALLLWLLLPFSAQGAPAGPTIAEEPSAPLVLGALYDSLSRSSPQIQAAEALARAVAYRAPAIRRPPDPLFQIGVMNRSVPSFAPMVPLGMTQLQLMQMLPLGGKLALAGAAADARTRAARHRVAEVRWELRARAAAAFYDLYAVDRSLEVAIVTRRLLVDIAATARAMYAVGTARQSDVLRAEVEIARMTAEIGRMQTMRLVTDAELARLLGREPSRAPARPSQPLFPTTLPDLDSLVAIGVVQRPTLRAGAEELQGAVRGTQLARRELWPDLQVGVQYGWQGGVLGTERMMSLMLGASLPVFARSRQLQMRDEASAMQTMAVVELGVMRAETRSAIVAAHAEWKRARELGALYRTTILPQAEATVAAAFSAYRVGAVDFMTLLDSQMAVNRFTQELFVLEADQGKALAELEMLLGRELFDPFQLAPAATRSPR